MNWSKWGFFVSVGIFVVAFLGVVATVVTYRWNKRRRRIDGVVDRYCEYARSRRMNQGVNNRLMLTPPPSKHTGVRGFLRAGARRLKDDGEIREAVKAVVVRLGTRRHPLGERGEELMESDADLRTFLSHIKTEGAMAYDEACREAGLDVEVEEER